MAAYYFCAYGHSNAIGNPYFYSGPFLHRADGLPFGISKE
jgi:hypothetical protein